MELSSMVNNKEDMITIQEEIIEDMSESELSIDVMKFTALDETV